MKKITAILMALTISGLLLFATGNAIAQSANLDIKINEIMFDPMGVDVGNEWIELYNNGTETQTINGWTISNRTGEIAATLPNWDFPKGAYLVVHFGTGTNDNDFSDGKGYFYTGINVEVFNNLGDECALYNGTPSASSIADFVSWSFDGYTPGIAHDYAVDAGIWTSGDFLELTIVSYYSLEGESIGRDKDSTDTDASDDWDTFGGKDAGEPTPGMRNLILLYFISGPIPPPLPKSWTIIIYLDGDNNLQTTYKAILNKIGKGGSSDDVNIVIQFDSKNLFGGTKRYYVTPGKKLVLVKTLAEQNMGDDDTLVNFVQWAKNNFVADKYALFIKDHGDGWKCIATDDTSGKDRIYMGELKDALSAITNNGQNKIDLLVFDACLMANIEVFYQVKDYADISVASEDIKVARQFQYTKSFNAVKADPTKTAKDFAMILVDNSENYGGRTMSAIDLSKIANLASDVSSFGAQLRDGIEDYGKDFTVHYKPEDNVQRNIRNQMTTTIYYRDANYIDLYDFAEKIGKDDSIFNKWKSKYTDVKTGIVKDAVIKKHGKGEGISIYFPTAQTKDTPPVKKADKEKPFDDPCPSPTKYDETSGFLFPNDKQWDEFLHRYYKPVADAGENKTVCVNKTVTFDGSGSSDSDGSIKKYEWDFGDSKYGSVKTPTHEYTSTGTYIVMLTVTDDDGKNDTDNATITVIHSYVVSSDYSGSEKNVFNTEDDVYCYGGNFPKNKYVDIYVVDEKDDWKDNDVLSDVGDGKDTIRTNDAGEIANTEIWIHPLRIGKYDIVVDVDQDGNYTMCRDAVDSNVEVGFEVIPEFTTIAIPAATIMGLIFLFYRRRRKE